MTHTSWNCRCGQVELDIDPTGGTRVICHCNSCRAFATRLGAEDTLDAWGGSDLFQVAPEAARFVKGASNLARTRLTPKGPLRWYTTCCNTPLANTLPTPKIPFVTLQTAFLGDSAALDPVQMRVFRKFGVGDVPPSKYGQIRLLTEFAARAIKSRLSGGWRRNPLFDEAGKPIGQKMALPDEAGR